MRYAKKVRLLVMLALGLAITATAQTLEYDRDRLGGDYARRTLSADNPQLCAALCAQDERCVAFTYTPTGFSGAKTPSCWMKDSQPHAHMRTGTVSGYFAVRLNGQQEAGKARMEDIQAGIAACRAKPFLESIEDMDKCYTSEAGYRKNGGLCDVQGGKSAADCHELIGTTESYACKQIVAPEAQRACFIRNAVEHRSVLGCRTAPEYIRTDCLMTVAVELEDISIVLDDPALPDQDRDPLAATYAIMAQDHDALDLIRDNRIYDQALTAITVNRIGAGRPVDPEACSKLLGGYGPDEESGLSDVDMRVLCGQGVAFAHAVSDYADTASPQELADMEVAVNAFLESGNFSDLSVLPEGLRMRVIAYHRPRALTASKPAPVAPLPAYETPIYGNDVLATPVEEPSDTGPTCLLGQC